MVNTDAGGPRFRDIVVPVLAICRARWRSLLLAGLVVFIPLGLVDVLAERLHDALTGEETATVVAASVAAFAAAIAALAGEVLYAGSSPVWSSARARDARTRSGASSRMCRSGGSWRSTCSPRSGSRSGSSS
jgi:type IV secretory pathway TrbL component